MPPESLPTQLRLPRGDPGGDHRLGRDSPRTRVENFAAFVWAFVHPGMYGEGEPPARMVRVAADAYGWSGTGLVDAMLAVVQDFQTVVEGDPGAMRWAAGELAHTERNADAFRAALGPNA